MWWRARRLAAMIGKWHWPSALQMLIARCAGVSKAEVALAHPLAVIMQRIPSTKTASTPPRRQAKDARFRPGHDTRPSVVSSPGRWIRSGRGPPPLAVARKWVQLNRSTFAVRIVVVGTAQRRRPAPHTCLPAVSLPTQPALRQAQAPDRSRTRPRGICNSRASSPSGPRGSWARAWTLGPQGRCSR